MSEVPEELRYTAEHEWVRVDGDGVRIGITDYAQDQLGDVVFVSLPEVGAEVAKGDAFAEIESTKSVSDIYAPVSGAVLTTNAVLVDRPEAVNADPYGEGWICELSLADAGELDALLDAATYRGLTA
jgi:glycine cleavage system H protein